MCYPASSTEAPAAAEEQPQAPACPICEDTGSYEPDPEVGSGYAPCPNGCDPQAEEK
jgi:hypothetical protein